MKKKIFLTLLCLFFFSSTALSYGLVYCPRCGEAGLWTGDWTQDAWGIHNIYQCPNGHYFTDGGAEPISNDPNVVSCPYCGFMATWTGDWTQDNWGIHNIYQCPNGHRFTLD
ncbi:MAG: hypothetical protein J6N21_23765 [Butyrivibrio sp.]|nr:hypothetical protein [Butyrivibrio sp.]